MTSAEILLHQNVLLDTSLAANVGGELASQDGLAELFDNVADEVRSIESRDEVVLSEQVDVGLDTRALVVGIVNELDTGEIVLDVGCHGGL